VSTPSGWKRVAPIAMVMAVVAAGTNIPVPLLLIYQEQLDLSSTQTVGLFGVYAAGLVPAVLGAGPLADRIGRRAVALGAVVVAAAVSIAYPLAADSVELLFVVRCLQGASAGAVFTVSTTWLLEMSGEHTERGARVAAVTMTAGFASGSLVGGVLGQWFPRPLVLVYVVHAVALVVALAWATRVPETMHRRSTNHVGSTILKPGSRRTALLVVAPAALFVFGFPATAISALPVLLGLPIVPVAATGLLASVTLGSGAVAAPWQRQLGDRAVPTAALLGAGGMTLAALAAALPWGALLMFPAAVALGAGGGLALSGGLARLPAIGMPDHRATVAAGFYATAYLGFAIPVLMSWASALVPISALLAILALLCLLVWRQQRA